MFYREGLLVPRPTPKLEDHPLSALHDCLFNLFAATLHIGGRSSIRNLRTRHAVVTGTQVFLNMNVLQGGVVSTSPAPKLEDHHLSAAHDCLFNLFAATLHIRGCSSIRNLRTRHAVVTGTHYTWLLIY